MDCTTIEKTITGSRLPLSPSGVMREKARTDLGVHYSACVNLVSTFRNARKVDEELNEV